MARLHHDSAERLFQGSKGSGGLNHHHGGGFTVGSCLSPEGLPRNITVVSSGRGAALPDHCEDVVMMVKRRAADDHLGQDMFLLNLINNSHRTTNIWKDRCLQVSLN